MYAYIVGEITSLEEGGIVLENHGIGYRIATSTLSMSHFQVNQTYKVYTVYVVRDDSVALYGFVDEDELHMFEMLNKVTSVGARSALSLLSTMTVGRVRQAILNNDIKQISQAPGIGKKTASRIVLELVDRVKKETPIAEVPTQSMSGVDATIAVDALVNLGYPKNEAQKAVNLVKDTDLTLEQMIREALRNLS